MPHIPPTADADGHAAWLQERFGPVPLTLLSWVRIVGDVWLVGTHPDWPESAAADPLVIQTEGSHYPGESFAEHFEASWQMWQQWSAEDPDAGPFQLELAPDDYHKGNVSGGDPYGIVVPDANADGQFVTQSNLPFVQYLNWVFLHGGFPKGTGMNGARITDALAGCHMVACFRRLRPGVRCLGVITQLGPGCRREFRPHLGASVWRLRALVKRIGHNRSINQTMIYFHKRLASDGIAATLTGLVGITMSLAHWR